MVEKIGYAGWPNCYRLTDGRVEIVATSDVGPRVVRFGFVGKENVFGGLEEDFGLTGGDEWRLYGGHRFWHSPEAKPRTYFPDNGPVEVETEDIGLRLIAPVESTTGIAKIVEVSLEGDRVRVVHTLRNEGSWAVELAPWALSVMAKNGVAVVPHPTSADPDRLLPNRTLMLWPYTDMTDPRVRWGSRFITLRQDPEMEPPIKFGISADDGWAAYLRGDMVFLKRFDFLPGMLYPDNGCSVECYTNDRFLELETLGPMEWLEPEEEVGYEERWYLFEGISCDTEDEEEIARALEPCVKESE